jgi:phenylacetate-coenzyme A ligase PaaK-like adenylate-forming protein
MSSNLFKSFSILDPVDDLVASLNEFQPTYLMTYPTAAVTLAEKNINGSLKIRPREVWTGGETLTKTTHQFIERAFGSQVRNSYGASEFLPIARECDLGNLHVNSDWVILEAVDEQYQPIPDGHMSRTTLLTNLANEVQPLIRYDIGDSIRFHTEKCPCGSHFPVIDVIGRKDGLIRISNDKGESINLLPLALATVMEEKAGIFDFQIVQKDKTTLLLRLPYQNNHPHPGLKRSEATLRKYLSKQGASKIELVAESIPKLIHNRSGKLNRIIVGKTH